jgi:DUF971 family protein
VTPVKIKVKDKKNLYILWEDKSESFIPLSELRKKCPCANCQADRLSRPASYLPLYSTVQLTLKDIKIVGSYAIQLYWQDGHDTGIYMYDFLKELGDEYERSKHR